MSAIIQDVAAVRVLGENVIGQVVDDGAQQAALFGERFLRDFAVRNVIGNRQQITRVAVAIENRQLPRVENALAQPWRDHDLLG